MVVVENDWENLGYSERPAETFGRLVRAFREARQLSQAELAGELQRLGWSAVQSTITKIEAGTRPVSVDEVALLAHVFDEDPAMLVAASTNERRVTAAKLRRLEREEMELASRLEAVRQARSELEKGSDR